MTWALFRLVLESGLTTMVQSETIPTGEVTSGWIWNRRWGNLVTLHPRLCTGKKKICTSLKKDKKKFENLRSMITYWNRIVSLLGYWH